jgi:hypothetical protein
MFVLDVKGEDYFIPDPERARLGQTIITLNPFRSSSRDLPLAGVIHGSTDLSVAPIACLQACSNRN